MNDARDADARGKGAVVHSNLPSSDERSRFLSEDVASASQVSIEQATPLSVPAELRPVQERERIDSLDVLRGIALLGILCVNIQLFAQPFGILMDPTHVLDESKRSLAANAFINIFCSFKFITMFSLLFGAGVCIQWMRAQAAHASFASLHVRRMLVLGVFGAMHGFLLWFGDILLSYAIVGTAMLALVWLKPRHLIISSIVLISISTVLGLGCTSLTLSQPSMSEAAAEVDISALSTWEAIAKAGGQPASPWFIAAEQRAFGEGPWTDSMVMRSFTYTISLVWALPLWGWRTLGMFCLGAALMKLDFFRPSGAGMQRRLAMWCLPIGLLVEAGVWYVNYRRGFAVDAWMIATSSLFEIGSLVLSLGYVGAITWLVCAGKIRALAHPFANAGRMALTVYLSETILATFVCYWWGLGLYGELDYAEQLGVVFAIYAALLVLASVWLRFFRMGPFEWLWRTLSYARVQPLLRR